MKCIKLGCAAPATIGAYCATHVPGNPPFPPPNRSVREPFLVLVMLPIAALIVVIVVVTFT